MGEGNALNFAQAAISVWLLDKDQGIVDKALARIELNSRQLKECDLVREDLSDIMSRIHPALHTDPPQNIKVLSNSKSPSPLLLEKMSKGELGIKSGKG